MNPHKADLTDNDSLVETLTEDLLNYTAEFVKNKTKTLNWPKKRTYHFALRLT